MNVMQLKSVGIFYSVNSVKCKHIIFMKNKKKCPYRLGMVLCRGEKTRLKVQKATINNLIYLSFRYWWFNSYKINTMNTLTFYSKCYFKERIQLWKNILFDDFTTTVQRCSQRILFEYISQTNNTTVN